RVDRLRSGGAAHPRRSVMNRTSFLARLRDGLFGLPAQEIDDIVADYASHFAEGQAAGRSEDEGAAALGNPARLAKELRAEAGLRRWEERRNPGNLAGAVIALLGLATVDLIFLLPLLFVVVLLIFIFGVVLFAVTIAGVGVVISILGNLSSIQSVLARGFAGVGLVAGGIGGGALLLLIVDALVRLLGSYARLHYQLLNPSTPAT